MPIVFAGDSIGVDFHHSTPLSVSPGIMAPPRKKPKKSHKSGNLFELDGALWKEGFRLVAGVDEAGRGPLAGPVVAAAAIFEPRVRLRGLDDSKKLSDKQRERLFERIVDRAVAYGVGVATPREIDRLNILRATHLAAGRAIEELAVAPDCLLTDDLKLNDHGLPCRSFTKADARSHAVAAASILAKVTRDRLMVEYDRDFPEYGLAGHKGYPTASHRAALMEHGVTTIHRLKYSPVAAALEKHGPRLRRSRTFQEVHREIDERGVSFRWECSKTLWRDYLPGEEWADLAMAADEKAADEFVEKRAAEESEKSPCAG